MGHNLTDLLASGSLFLFTGVELASTESTILELISKLGVVAVLWFWLRDLKKQMKEQSELFDKETNEIRMNYDRLIANKDIEHAGYKDRLEKEILDKSETIKILQDKLLENK